MNNGKIPSIIRWTRSDYAKLSYAVREFNKRVTELEGLEQNIAPPSFDYKEVKENIYSRRELNRVIKSLKRFGKESQQRVVETPAGVKLTQWELSELKKAQKRSISRTTDKARLIVESDINVMGDKDFKQLSNANMLSKLMTYERNTKNLLKDYKQSYNFKGFEGWS